MDFNNFPEELLVMIFDYVSSRDLRNLALVCNNFNFVISNTSSLVRKLKVTLNHRKVESSWTGTRRYETFKIIGCNKSEFERYVGIFTKYGPHVRYLAIERSTFNLGSLKVLFVLCPNIRRVALKYNNIDQTTDFPFVLRYLTAIEYEGESLSIDKFKMSVHLTTMVLSGNQSYPEIQTERFLAMQRKLLRLRLTDFSSNSFIFASPHFQHSIQFRLEYLSLVNVELPANPRMFRNFLNHHKDTLSYLEICSLSFDILPYFNNFKKLKTIKFTSFYERDLQLVYDVSSTPLNHVENLIIDCQNIINIGIKFPNLITLEMFSVKINPAEIMSLRYLESLTIHNVKSIPNFEVSNVRNIKFNSCHFTGNRILTNNRRFIQKLSVIKCKNVNWLNDFFDYEYLNLKHLELTRTKIRKSLYMKIMRMERKMERCIVSSNQLMSKFEVFKQKFDICLEHLMKCISCLCEPQF